MTELRPLFTVEGLLKGLLRVGVKFSEDELQHVHAGDAAYMIAEDSDYLDVMDRLQLAIASRR
eukprot:6468370-Amphidinium_carterae.1